MPSFVTGPAEITPLPKRRAYNCYSSCVTLVLERMGEMFSEPVALGLSRGVNIEFQFGQDLHYRAVRETHCVTEFLKAMGVEVERVIEPSPATFDEIVWERISNDLPVMVECDGFYLPFTQVYRTRHERRICLIVGIGPDHYLVNDPIYGVARAVIGRALMHKARAIGNECVAEPAWYRICMRSGRNCSIGPSDIRAATRATAEYLNPGFVNGEWHCGAAGAEAMAGAASDVVARLQGGITAAAFADELRQGSIVFAQYAEFFRITGILWPMAPTLAWPRAAAAADAIASHLQISASLVWKASRAADSYPERLKLALGNVASAAREGFGELGDSLAAAGAA